MHYLDLPVLVREPSLAELQNALNELKQEESSNFESTDELDKGTRQWLSRLTCADLSWLCENDAEEIRASAARRLAQECGVTASAQRIRKVFLSSEPDVPNEHIVQLQEPGMTEDQLGKLTWGSSLVLAQRFARDPGLIRNKTCIELGAGTGLCAIAAARLGAKAVDATDLPEIVPNLKENVELNSVEHLCRCYTLDWASMPIDTPPQKFDICIVSDPVYSRDHPPLLLATVRWVHAESVLLQLPLRAGFEPERETIYNGLKELYRQVDYAEEAGRDLFGEQKFAYSKWVLKSS